MRLWRSQTRHAAFQAPKPAGSGWARFGMWASAISGLVAAVTAIVTRQWFGAFVALTLAGSLATGLNKWAEFREKRAKAEQEWRAQVSKLLRVAPSEGRLPRLSELTDAQLGVTPTRYTLASIAPYLARPEADAALDTLITRAGPPWPFILLFGNSKAGKSRTIVEAARRNWKSVQVIAPKDGAALAELALLEPELPIDDAPALVWLDDLEAADLEQLTDAVFNALLDKAFVVATITASRYNDIQRTGSEAPSTAKTALQRAECRELRFALTNDERMQAEQLYPDENFDRSEKFDRSIGETLVGGEELCAKLRAGGTDNPAGQAIVHAAIDCVRAGIPNPVNETVIRHLFPLYLHRTRINLDPTTERFNLGMDWATEPVTSHVALMGKADTEESASWEVLDYVVTADDGDRKSVV